MLQTRFVNAVSGSLIQAPNFRSREDPFRSSLIKLADDVAERDPEFVLKVPEHFFFSYFSYFFL
jgi:hypothetical protein